MNKNLKANQKHLTLSDRIFIEQELLQGSNFRTIASTYIKTQLLSLKKYVVHPISFLHFHSSKNIWIVWILEIVMNIVLAVLKSAKIFASIFVRI
ncbi:hypothetical protein EDD66_111113 [Mobilisporobacter senegalensis]|uniref:Uncharacterized protein n=1 Tax=Mobilisporobacter senegalensis TaxID=1329262 RepID=A0A3N1XF52_9FIRM|nr:helix-turn-helix domain-containing protein [Mobilisporobacter senegalensis]ROR25350.1 hypothetical protein EDD66_111113 [Mobilisporobacter senegalensis]